MSTAGPRTSSTVLAGSTASSPQITMWVRALYDYEADDRTSLSFHEGDIIQVITQLESGWWDGVINGIRGWFPSNYCQIVTGPNDDTVERQPPCDDDEEGTREDEYEESCDDDDDDGSTRSGDKTQSTAEGFSDTYRSRADFWIPQATSDGRLFYFNTMTGESSTELPLESPTSAIETGPRDRMTVNIPEKTRPPRDMMTQLHNHEDDYDSAGNSASEMDPDPMPRQRRSYVSEGLSPATSTTSIHETSLSNRARHDPFYTSNLSITVAAATPAVGLSSTSFTSAQVDMPYALGIPRVYFDDDAAAPLTWTRLVTNMKRTIDAYREAVNNGDRSEYVRRAEDISDHLRILLAAGSRTTDNHSGQPSIISTNKALYPHFRDMMSKFSKLVISSHIAAADWPTAESYQKCLQEADGVLQGVLSYVEVARQQRGEELPRLSPGFIIGSSTGGNWRNNGLSRQDPMTSNLPNTDEGSREPNVALDTRLLQRVDDLKRMLVASIRRLEEHLIVTEKVVSSSKHDTIGNRICAAAGEILETFRPWSRTIESADLGFLGTEFETPQLIDFRVQKQGLYDNAMDLMINCQAVTGPMSDEWSEVRGDALERRLDYVRHSAQKLELNCSHLGFSLQLLADQHAHILSSDSVSRDDAQLNSALLGKDYKLHESLPQRQDMRQAYVHRREGHTSTLSASLQAQESFDATSAIYRQAENSKVKKFFGEDPRTRDQEGTPDYLLLDHESDLVYDTKADPPMLKGGTLVALVEQLTRHDRLESNFNGTFLLTYRSFTNARELFQMLVKRFQVQPPDGMVPADYETWRDRKQKPIRFRVVNILKSWLDTFWMEDQSEAVRELIRDIHSFARDTVKSTDTPGSGPLMTVLEQRLRGQDTSAKRLVLTLNQATPLPIMPKNMKKLKFLDIDATEFARQLTIVESKLYGKIKPTECLNKTWQKKTGDNEAEPAPMVKALILHSNQLTNWVAEMILTQQDVKKRVVVIKHFVSVADKCRGLNNFSTLTSIISALGTAPIHRLKRTWDQVPARTQTILEQMRRLMGSTKNFGEYRESLHQANPPCIPFFGVYLTDLTFIEDGIPSVIKNSGMINFAKRAKTAEVIRDIQQYQNVPYPLQPVPELQEYILSNMQAAGDVHEMYEKSLLVEPREREDEKIVRVLAESGFL